MNISTIMSLPVLDRRNLWLYPDYPNGRYDQYGERIRQLLEMIFDNFISINCVEKMKFEDN